MIDLWAKTLRFDKFSAMVPEWKADGKEDGFSQ
jgi:hypothetical protein